MLNRLLIWLGWRKPPTPEVPKSFTNYLMSQRVLEKPVGRSLPPITYKPPTVRPLPKPAPHKRPVVAKQPISAVERIPTPEVRYIEQDSGVLDLAGLYLLAHAVSAADHKEQECRRVDDPEPFRSGGDGDFGGGGASGDWDSPSPSPSGDSSSDSSND